MSSYPENQKIDYEGLFLPANKFFNIYFAENLDNLLCWIYPRILKDILVLMNFLIPGCNFASYSDFLWSDTL